MCGIAGIISPEIHSQIQNCQKMTMMLNHRGPDDRGFWNNNKNVAFGHTRLAILDPSNSGHQPMLSKCGDFCLIYNGEIYNYLELKKEIGGEFISGCDTEVLLKAYEKWGIDCLRKLRGMFSFAIYDERKRCVYIVRDRFGIKPLYYSVNENNFYFASEIKALTKTSIISNEPDYVSIGEYLTTSIYDYGERTFFKNVKKLLPSHLIKIDLNDNNKIKISKYYTLENNIKPSEVGFEEAKKLYISKIKDCVNIHLRSDVPIGFNVSGGVDSSALISLASQKFRKSGDFRMYSINYNGTHYSEKKWTDEVVSHTQKNCTYINISCEDIIKELPSMLDCQDEPFGGVPSIAWMLLYHQAKKDGTKVLLDGTGIDDCLAGYKPEVMMWLANKKGHPDFNDELEGFSKYWGLSREKALQEIFSRTKRHNVTVDGTIATNLDVISENLKINKYKIPSLSPWANAVFRNSLFNSVNFYKIPRALRFKDRVSMAYSCELRVPFMDHELVELSFSLPEKYLVHRGINKYIMREALQDKLPEKVRVAPKRSIQTPQREWFKKGPLANMLLETINNPSDFLKDIINISAAKEAYKQYCNGDDANSNYLWQWLNLELWYSSR